MITKRLNGWTTMRLENVKLQLKNKTKQTVHFEIALYTGTGKDRLTFHIQALIGYTCSTSLSEMVSLQDIN